MSDGTQEKIELNDKVETPHGIIREVTAIDGDFAEVGSWEWFPLVDLKLVSKGEGQP